MRTEQDTVRSAQPVACAYYRGVPRGMVAIGSSAGGVEALSSILAALSPSFPLPILIAQHVSRRAPSILDRVLGWRTTLPVRQPQDGEWPQPGIVYVAPSDRHLIVGAAGELRLSQSPRVNHTRPAADPLFLSLARMFGDTAIAVVLTGYGMDGARGIEEVRRVGGMAIAQDEESSTIFEMPRAAIDIGKADLVLSLSKIAYALTVLAEELVYSPALYNGAGLVPTPLIAMDAHPPACE